MQLVFVGNYFSDKLFVCGIVKDPTPRTNLGRESAAFGALEGFRCCQPIGGSSSYRAVLQGVPDRRVGTQNDPYVVFRAGSNGTGRASVGSPLVA